MTEWIAMIVLGLLLILMGILNLRGDLSSIHWYNRRKVAAEHRSAYGRCMGAGSAAIGGGLLLTGLLQLARPMEAWYWIALLGVILGLGLMLYGQFRYNRGIF